MVLAVYTYVFSVIFNMKWGVASQGGRLEFALALFVGILTFNILGEVANAAPTLIITHVNYVKKVVFPLEILPLVKLFGALINSFFGIIIILIALFFSGQNISWTLFLLPIVWLPVVLFSLGLGFLLSALGVFIRDIGASIGVIVNMFFFLSPIFYPIEAVPSHLRIYCRLNPIAIFVENARRVVLWGRIPDWPWYLGSFLIALLILISGYAFFMKSKRAFADVI
jgi:lipopolysaccharide transport system permease protein